MHMFVAEALAGFDAEPRDRHHVAEQLEHAGLSYDSTVTVSRPSSSLRVIAVSANALGNEARHS